MSTPQKFQTYRPGQHVVRGIPFKAHKIDGFSPEMLERHFEEIYGGAVRRLNEIECMLADGQGDDILRAEQLTTADAVFLHELHFGSIAEDGGEALSDATLRQAIVASFGNAADWKAEFSAMAKSLTGGWVVLAWSNRFDRLINIRITEASQALLGADPVLVVDVNEHAYRSDFGTDREAYIATFIKSIHWGHIAERFRQALGEPGPDQANDDNQISVAELKDRLDNGEDMLVLDVRHDDDRERYTNRIMETEWRDSFDVADWAKVLPKDKPIVVYCMYGFWVSQKAAEELRVRGINARSLIGGVTAWRAMGYPSTSNVTWRASFEPELHRQMLQVDNLKSRFFGPVSLNIAAGECVAIRGPSGAGKSMLLRAVADLDPNEGGVTWAGQSRERMSAPQWRQRVGLVPAESGWWADRVCEHFGTHANLPKLLNAVGMPEEALTWNVARLSTGERHRLAIIRCLALEPTVLLLDEPTAALDSEATDRVERLLRQKLDNGTAIMVVTHDPAQANRIASRIATMEAGILSDPASIVT